MFVRSPSNRSETTRSTSPHPLLENMRMKSVYVVMLGLLTYTVGCVPEDDAVEWETNQAAITGLGSSVSYTKGLIRLDLNGSIGGCSGVLIAPNMIATAAHCVDDNTSLSQ